MSPTAPSPQDELRGGGGPQNELTSSKARKLPQQHAPAPGAQDKHYRYKVCTPRPAPRAPRPAPRAPRPAPRAPRPARAPASARDAAAAGSRLVRGLCFVFP